ncbi:MAG: hypothetical protein H6716_23460 [Polyangiaceae bacterium]|nr:hypothetical protein [Polyangiaceae bacterium]
MRELAVLTPDRVIPSPAPPFLTGVEPFPGLEGWIADAALFARQNLESRAHGGSTCRQLLAHVDASERLSWVDVLLCPEVFAFLTSAPKEWSWDDLHEAILARGERSAGLPYVLERPGPVMLRILRRSGSGSRRASCEDASFVDPASEDFASHRTSLQRAYQLIAHLAPGFATEIRALVDCIAIVDEQASFRGASGLQYRGMIMLSPTPDWTCGVFAEELVHEATHTLLDLISVREPLLSGRGALDQAWPAPFRPDRRHLFGNFHALVVVARLIHLFRAFEYSEVRSECDWRARAIDYAVRSRGALEAVDAYPTMSPMARRLLDRLVKPTLGEALSDHGTAPEPMPTSATQQSAGAASRSGR